MADGDVQMRYFPALFIDSSAVYLVILLGEISYNYPIYTLSGRYGWSRFFFAVCLNFYFLFFNFRTVRRKEKESWPLDGIFKFFIKTMIKYNLHTYF